MSLADDTISSELALRKSKGLLRQLPEENQLIDFCSNDYLGLARSKELADSVNAELEKEDRAGGSTGSRLITGNSHYAEELETFIADYHKAEAGLIYNSGYDANLGLLSSVPGRNDTIIHDELIHASIRDGIRLGLAKSYAFDHNDVSHLETQLKRAENRVFVAVESVYSMDGDLAPLKEICFLCEKYGAQLIIDEAHATGVFGMKGEGRVVELGLEDQVFARVHTFGKAIGGHGAVVLGSADLRNYLINFSRSFIYTTALPMHGLFWIKNAYDIMSKQDFKELKSRQLYNLLKTKIEYHKSIPSFGDFSPVVSVNIGDLERAKSVAKSLQNEGFDVRAILSPTVPRGTERLRICLHTFNTELEVEGLGDSLNKYL
ncbi:TPA: pyridoxal phosphate-dependent aminotransferase family protein [Candidatus Poribacteria bacterium]|nr:pyridoxal phosphate-dependent aminotransferase family protein [Flavobacteriales bacterium]HIB89648.1 pyridoxal phosphate-dependent aminotransferase family protein [Candidatus Poribacteria bacterium]